MRYWKLTVSAFALAVLLAACSQSEEQAPAPPAPAPKKESVKPPPVLPSSSAIQSKTSPAVPQTTPAVENAESVASLENSYVSTPDFTTRVEAIYKLADVGTPEAIGSLGRLFHKEKDADLKTEILDSLFDIDGHDESKAALFAAGAGADQPKEVRESAIDGLEDVKPEIALPILRALAGDPDEEIREAAKDAIEMLQTQ